MITDYKGIRVLIFIVTITIAGVYVGLYTHSIAAGLGTLSILLSLNLSRSIN